ncbi:class II fructose-bisphosphate aldolase [Tetragenococcus halophilus]|uniref:class II fructose-bisphosphate aldolase n=1 Tax=Tetragenococcus halophilus TaxID=51669 RepID=UPI00077C12EF|nr:class II fructose-bisphosphate aldolase [Tetragenococcus halophilus]MCO8284750.1 class II fructose-bisphosphate aldolase [Tetragenococcus halophilus]NWO00930.1 class II fructose-bisphosphate aldolase [Tetragenococcus halophilus]RQD33152.1 class II fructose-bisphosphate aldolase [Tetragenococcus halophilus subsp. halophilus DSM 20339]GBD60288.1 hypothetical protein TEHN0098T_2284 [Tetragenococcus halophilus subsp. halophilus]GBD66776.1 hypothetical protein TEHN7116_1740 [Tetragenococcus halo
MLVNMKELLAEAKKNKKAVGAFNVPTLENIRAIIEAAEELDCPVILAHAQVHEKLISLPDIIPIMLHYAKKAKVPVAVHLDHGSSFDICVHAIREGVTSIMYDASDKDFETNLTETKEMVKIAHAAGVSVEAELGHIFTSEFGGEGTDEGRVSYAEKDNIDNNFYTDAGLAKKFVDETGVDFLAIAFGTVHGVYVKKPNLNMDVISEVVNKVDIPLVMHGGSGVSAENYKLAIERGITKINYFTYMNKAGGQAVKEYIEDNHEMPFFDEISTVAIDVMKENVKEAMRVFNN